MSVLVLALLLTGADAFAQLQVATVAATIVDQRGQPVSNAVVALTDPLGAELRRVTSDANGRTLFDAVAPGRYLLQTRAPRAAAFDLPLVVSGALPIELIVRVPDAVTDTVTVEGRAPIEASTRGSIAGDTLDRVPARVRARAVQDAIATLPGWSTEDNGLLHARGVDDGFLYVIDGIPAYERLDAVSGVAPDLTSASAVSVITGYVPPEFGHKGGGVIEMRSASPRATWHAMGDAGFGSDTAREGSLAVSGSITPTLGIRAGATGYRSNRILDPVHPDNLHNSGHIARTYGQVDSSLTSDDRLAIGWNYAGSAFDVPNTMEQQQAGQHQRQHLRQLSFNGTWQRIVSTSTVLHAALYHRRSNARLAGTTLDTPLFANADRQLLRTGGVASTSHQRGNHLVKLGLEWQQLYIREQFTFAVTNSRAARAADFRDEVLAFTRGNPFLFSDDTRRTLWSLFAQNSWQLAPRLTLSGGLRYDRSALLLTRSELSPRLGVAWQAGARTAVRAALNRFFQPPQPENLLLSSSREARVLSSISVGNAQGGADLEPERQWAGEIGVEQQIAPRLRLNVAYWQRAITDVADPNVLAGTTIIFPNAVARGRARGIETRLELPRHDGWSGYLNWSVARVVQTGPITGGLFLEDDVEQLGAGVDFFPDHDQRVAAGGGVTWEQLGVVLSATARYESGTPLQFDEDDLDELMARPGADRVDFAAGRVKPRMLWSVVATAPLFEVGEARVTATVQVLNVVNQSYAYNFGNPFSGTHFGAPRTVAVTLRVTFR